MDDLPPQVDDAPFSDEAHGESWAQPLEDNINLDDGLAELGLGGDPNEVVGDDGLAELEDEVPAQYDDANYDANYDNAAPNYDDTMFMEAEEEAPKPMSAAMRKKQREHEEHLGLVEMVKVLCIKMEKALEDDADDVMKGQPGLRKLTMLNEIEQCSNQVKAHPILLNSGILGILKGFLEPLMTPRANKAGDNLLALPHLSIRQLVYKILAALPIATHSQEGRNLLKASGIGPVLRFYAKVKHETEANRRTVGDLLNRWMLPIIEEGRKAVKDDQMEAERLRQVERDMRRRRVLDKEQDEKDQQRLTDQQKDRRIGDAGYRSDCTPDVCSIADRYHARVPKMQRPDYVHAPVVADHIRHIEKGKVNKDKGVKAKLTAATRKLQQVNKVGASTSTKLETATKNVGNEIV